MAWPPFKTIFLYKQVVFLYTSDLKTSSLLRFPCIPPSLIHQEVTNVRTVRTPLTWGTGGRHQTPQLFQQRLFLTKRLDVA